MNKKIFVLAAFIFCFTFFSFSQTTEVVFIQLNDVYEIAPLEGGRFGGLARVSGLVTQYRAKNPFTYVVLSGDFISPSAIGTSQYEGKSINGRQMVDVMNAIGVDFVTFGNHEFDYKYDVLQDRIDESKFQWISSNVSKVTAGVRSKFCTHYPYVKSRTGTSEILPCREFPEYKILSIPGNLKGEQIKLGLLGLCIDANQQPYVHYENYVDAAKRVYGNIKDSIDYLLGITHLSIDEDKNLAGQMPELKLIMGGHEHVNMYHKVGETVIAKADANARTIYIHRLTFDENSRLLGIKSELVSIDSKVYEDPLVKNLVDEWTTRAYKGFIDKGFDPLKLVYDLGSDTLDGREETVRYGQCALGHLIANSMFDVCPGAELAFFNSGAIRIDDQLTGEITQYDIIRVLPFGGKILQVDMKGSLLKQVLETGWGNTGNGGYLQFFGAEYTAGGWKVKGQPIDESKTYNAGVADYLLTGMEQNFAYFTKDNPGIVKITYPDPNNKEDLRNDVRFAVIDYFSKWSKTKSK